MERIHQDETDLLWYFWDETDADRIGPYNTRAECVEGLMRYSQEVLGP
jgi:hypothetical protein